MMPTAIDYCKTVTKRNTKYSFRGSEIIVVPKFQALFSGIQLHSNTNISKFTYFLPAGECGANLDH